LLIHDETVGKLIADIIRALGTVGYTPLNDAWPHGTGLVDQTRIVGQASVADDALGWYPEPEVLLPAIAQDFLVRGLRFNVRSIGEAKIASVPASG